VAGRLGALLAPYLDENLTVAASLSMVSHSLGARVVLATAEHLTMRVRRLVLMAGAVDNNCLTGEFAEAAAKVDSISVLASRKDTVLSEIFPLGNLIAGILDEGHPWFRAALGHRGPARPWPGNFRPPFEIPDGWEYRHSSYLKIDPPPLQVPGLPVVVPGQGAPLPGTGAGGAAPAGWEEGFSSGFVSTRFQ
jgi:pimeloyl-ACP methyl ester carboxylesterase